MAKSGHLSSHILHPMQSSGLAANTFSFFSSSTFFGQRATHMLQPLQYFALTM